MKKIIGLALLLSLSTAFAQVNPAGKDTSGGAAGKSATAGSSKAEAGSMGTTGSQGTIAESPADDIQHKTCTTDSGKELKKADKGYAKCMKAKMKK